MTVHGTPQHAAGPHPPSSYSFVTHIDGVDIWELVGGHGISLNLLVEAGRSNFYAPPDPVSHLRELGYPTSVIGYLQARHQLLSPNQTQT